MRRSNPVQSTAAAKFRAFCKHGSLHGLYYFSEKQHWTVFVIWSTIITSSFILCVYLSNMIWMKLIVDPTFTVVETTHFSTTQIPFPAVTVCDTEIVYGPHTGNITNVLQHRSFDERQIEEFYKSFNGIKKNDYHPPEYLRKMHKALHDLGYSFDVLLETLSKPCDVLLVQCTWRAQIHNCSEMFRKTYTVAGYCCEFDMKYFKKNANPNTNFVPGVERGEALGVLVDGEKVSYKDTVSDGYVWLYVYDAKTRITVLDSPATLTPAGYFDVNVFVWAIDSSTDVKTLSVKERRCYLRDEMVDGRTFYQECMSLHILRQVVSSCRCLPFNYTAKKLQVEDYPRCNWDRLMCVYRSVERVRSNIKDIVKQNDCLQRCDYVQYATDIKHVKYQRETNNINDKYSRVVVHYTSTTCFKYKREVIYSWDQMLANLGGIFGLCLGGSIISLIELVWFVLDFSITFLKGLKNRKTVPATVSNKKHVFTLTERDLETKMPIRDKMAGRYKFVN